METKDVNLSISGDLLTINGEKKKENKKNDEHKNWRTEIMIKIQKILFPIDLTDNSSKVFPYVLSVSEKYGSEICLLHVVEDFSKWSGTMYIPHIPLEQYREDALKGAERNLAKVCEEQLQGYRDFQKIIVYGDPAQEIIKTIESENIDMVVMGTHGRKGLENVLFGSVARNVVRRSPVPVLIVNPYKVK